MTSPGDEGAQMATLFERLGGLEAITAVVDSVVARQAGDDRINRKFGRTDVAHLKKNFVDQLCAATGGPCTYTGRSMPETHDGMQVTAGEFEVFIQDVEEVLDEFNVPKSEHDELVELLLSMRNQIVEVASPETGTPLPDAYRAYQAAR
jgi:hemoglobin